MFDQLKKGINSISPITPEDWDLLEPYLKVTELEKGRFYLREGEVEQQIGFINRGSFRWYFLNENGDEVNFHFFLDNSFVVGYDSFVTQTPSRLYIQAMEFSEVVLFPKHDKILELYARSHHWERFGRIICEQVYANSTRRVQDFLFRSAEERYLDLLGRHPDIFQRVSLANISSYLGIQGPSLSRIRKRLLK